MKIPTVEYCCSGCSLRTGTLIIAVFGLVCSVISAIISAGDFVALQYILDHPEKKEDEVRAVAPELMVLLASQLGFCAIAFVINCLLLLGTNQNKARLVRIWVIVSLVLLAIEFGLVITQFVVIPEMTVSRRLFVCLLQFYFIKVVHSFYKQLCKEGAVQ